MITMGKSIRQIWVNFALESVTGDTIKFDVMAYKANKVTGSMSALDWTQHAQRWSHLQHISFPRIAKRPHFDVLLGLDYADLHWAIQGIRG